MLTEDSDLAVYGCPTILTKFALLNSRIDNKRVIGTDISNGYQATLQSSLRDWDLSFANLQDMCILAGVDYLPSLPGIGLQRACEYLKTIVSSKKYVQMPLALTTVQYSYLNYICRSSARSKKKTNCITRTRTMYRSLQKHGIFMLTR